MTLKPTTHRWTEEDRRMLDALAESHHLPRAAMLRKLIRDAFDKLKANGKVQVRA